MRNKYILIIFLILGIQLNGTKKVVPAWVSTHPEMPGYYTGIGHATKTKGKTNYKQEAIKDALNNLSGEISIQIFSSEEFIRLEKNKKVKQEFTSLIQSRVHADLEGYEFTEEYETRKDYWVYYRLSKEIYKENEWKKMTDAVSNARASFLLANDYEKKYDFRNAIIQYAKSLDFVKKYINEHITVEVEGINENLVMQCFNRVAKITENIHIIPSYKSLDVKLTAEIPEENLTFSLVTRENIPVGGFPLSATYSERSITDYSKTTDNQGKVSYTIPKVRSEKNIETIRVQPDINYILFESATDFVVRNALTFNNVEITEVPVNIIRPSISLQISQLYNDRFIQDNTVYNQFSTQLQQSGYKVVSENADIRGEINIALSLTGNINGIIQMQLTGNINFSNEAGRVIYSAVINPVKGSQLTVEKTLADAIRNFSNQIETKYCRELTESIVK